MRSLADKFREALLNNYDQARREIGIQAPEFLRVLDVHGAVDAARQVIHGLGPGIELRRGLRQGKRLELSVEATMLRPEFAPLFSRAELAAARDTLAQYGYHAPWDTDARGLKAAPRVAVRPEPVAEIPPVPRSALVMAIEVFDREQRRRPEWRGWERQSTLRLALRHDGRLYPIKEIVRMATGAGSGTRDEDAVEYVRKRGFEVAALARPAPEPDPEPEPETAKASPASTSAAPAELPAATARASADEPVRAEPTPPVAAPAFAVPAPPPIPDATRDDLLIAMEMFDGDERTASAWQDQAPSGVPQYALRHAERLYPLDEIIRLATGTQHPFTDEQACEYVRSRGFEVVPASSMSTPGTAAAPALPEDIPAPVAAAEPALAAAPETAPVPEPRTDAAEPPISAAPPAGHALPALAGQPPADRDLPPAIDVAPQGSPTEVAPDASAGSIRSNVKAYALLVQCDMQRQVEWFRARLDLGEVFDRSPLLGAAERETLALARFLWTGLEDQRALDFSGPAALLIDVLDRAARQSICLTLPRPGNAPGDALGALLAHRGHIERAISGREWHVQIAPGQAYTVEQWLDALPSVIAVRDLIAAGERVYRAMFGTMIDGLCGTPLTGAGMLNGLLLAWQPGTPGTAGF